MKIQDLQSAAVDRMTADPLFDGLVVVKDGGDVLTGTDLLLVEDELARGLNEDGVAFRVPLTRGDAIFPALPLVFCEFDMLIEVWFRRYGPGGVFTDWLETVIGFFHFWKPLQSGQVTSPNRPVWQVREENGFLVGTVAFRATSAIGIETEKVLRPTATNDNGSVTLACATVGSTIYATTSGSSPTLRDDQLVTGPVAVTTGQTLLARAYAPGKLASDLLKLVI